MDMIETLGKAGIIPVIVIEKEEQAVPLAKALVKGGLPVLEVTFRTKAAAGAIAAIKREVPEAVLGAGTLLTPQMVKDAKAAGAVFGVAPGFDPAVMAAAIVSDTVMFKSPTCTQRDRNMAERMARIANVSLEELEMGGEK